MNDRQENLIAKIETEVNYLLRSQIESKLDYTGEELRSVAIGLLNFFREEVGSYLVDF